MSEDEILYYLIAFILGWLISRMMGNGVSISGSQQKRQRSFHQWDLPGTDPGWQKCVQDECGDLPDNEPDWKVWSKCKTQCMGLDGYVR